MQAELQRKIKVLNERVWEGRANWPLVERWLQNFTGETCSADEERIHALYVLSQMMYFGSREIRALLKAMYRESYRYPVIEQIRRGNGDTTDTPLINNLYLRELSATRFLGIGNPSESGTHLLYHFRQENKLPKNLFINSHEIFLRAEDGVRLLRDKSITRYVFLDDLCGSGQQAKEYSKEILADLKHLEPRANVSYCVLFAMTSALDEIRSKTLFDQVTAVFELDSSFRCFAPNSRYFSKPVSGIDFAKAKQMCWHYGVKLYPLHPLGYRDCELLLSFHHNTPDNTLPVIWFDEDSPPWQPIFKRYPKFSWW